MSGTTSPPSQKGDTRTIAFALEVNGAITAQVILALRPEDFTRNDTSRVNVHHTLGGAWADNFGPGLPTIQIAGHTGWRGGQDGNGEDRWRTLRDTIFTAWHNRRKEAVEQGRDPATVKLIYADMLHGFDVEVAPMALTLRRSKSRPLLIQYQLTLTVLDQNREQLRFLQGGAGEEGGASGGGFFASVTASIARIRGAIQGVTRWVQTNLVQPVRAFLGMANSVFGGVMGIVRDVRSLVGSVVAIPLAVAQAGTNLFRTLAAVASLPMQIKADIMGVAGAFSNIWCFLLRSRSARLAYADYNPFFGASNCSSISGGRPVSPLAGANPWNALPAAAALPGLSVSNDGRTALIALASSDPVQRPMNDNELSSTLVAVQRGVRVEAAA